jgi:hypothetical protein
MSDSLDLTPEQLERLAAMIGVSGEPSGPEANVWSADDPRRTGYSDITVFCGAEIEVDLGNATVVTVSAHDPARLRAIDCTHGGQLSPEQAELLRELLPASTVERMVQGATTEVEPATTPTWLQHAAVAENGRWLHGPTWAAEALLAMGHHVSATRSQALAAEAGPELDLVHDAVQGARSTINSTEADRALAALAVLANAVVGAGASASDELTALARTVDTSALGELVAAWIAETTPSLLTMRGGGALPRPGTVTVVDRPGVELVVDAASWRQVGQDVTVDVSLLVSDLTLYSHVFDEAGHLGTAPITRPRSGGVGTATFRLGAGVTVHSIEISANPLPDAVDRVERIRLHLERAHRQILELRTGPSTSPGPGTALLDWIDAAIVIADLEPVHFVDDAEALAQLRSNGPDDAAPAADAAFVPPALAMSGLTNLSQFTKQSLLSLDGWTPEQRFRLANALAATPDLLAPVALDHAASLFDAGAPDAARAVLDVAARSAEQLGPGIRRALFGLYARLH